MNRRLLLAGFGAALALPGIVGKAEAQTVVRPGKSFRAYPSNAMIHAYPVVAHRS